MTQTTVNGLRSLVTSLLRRAKTWMSGIASPRTEYANGSSEGPKGQFNIAVYFGSQENSLYQLRPWLEVLAELNQSSSVGLVVRYHNVFRTIKEETDLPVVFVPSFRDLSVWVADNAIKTCLYVNHASANYQMLRFASFAHVHIGHGESEKQYMASNQIKAYDYVLVAGDAAIERLETTLFQFERSKALVVGRPQVRSTTLQGTSPPTVLYAPTYEGDIVGASYTSVGSMGIGLVERIVASGHFRLVYRPHPLTGVHDGTVRKNDQAIRRIVRQSEGIIDEDSEMGHLMAGASVLVTDRSAVAVDWLAHDRPLFITQLGDDDYQLLEAAYVLTSENVDDVVQAIERALEKDDLSATRRRLASRHLGPGYMSGQATERFVETVHRIVDERDRWATALESRRSGDDETQAGSGPLP